jgi:hypothetical protein
MNHLKGASPMEKMKKLATIIAATAAVTFVTAPITATLANAKDVKCYGVNSCKGKSKCKTANNACKGKNSCKGKGVMKMSEKRCAKKHGTTTEPTAEENNTANPATGTDATGTGG